MITKAHARKLRTLIVKASESLSDTEALQGVELFDEWKTGTEYEEDKRIRYDSKLYRVLQSHTSQSDWTPDKTPSLYTEVKEQGQGTRDNPIPYNNNMALEEGKYYSQYEVVYLCFRSTEIAVYNDLADLVGIYVNEVE